MNWWRRWRERRRNRKRPVKRDPIKELYEDSPTETPFLTMVRDHPESAQLFGIDEVGYRQLTEDGVISLAQFKKISQLFIKARADTASPEQVTAEYLGIMGQTDAVD